MTRARKHLVCLSDTPYYHVTSRCVRRAFLCGKDTLTGKSYEHRRGWIEDRIRVLSSLFAIDVCAYAVMSNHYHLVVKLCPNAADAWSNDEILDRWTAIFKGPLLVQRQRKGDTLNAAEQNSLDSMTAIYRKRLTSLSWFMKCLNEPIARKANLEDRCTGHFWEARFHSEALRTDQALVAAMVYVDLNPIRAKLSRTPETSDFTSVKTRIIESHIVNLTRDAVLRVLERRELNHFSGPIKPLMPFAGRFARQMQGLESDQANRELPVYEHEYLKLVDITGRHIALGKRGSIDPALEPILSRLHFSLDQWIQVSSSYRKFIHNGQLRLKRAA